MKFYFYLTFIIALIIGCNNKQSSESVSPKQRNIIEYVYASASVVPENIYGSQSSRSGIIKDVFIEIGDEVSIGDPLFSIRPTADASNRLNNAMIDLQESRDNLYGSNSKLKNIENELKNIIHQNLQDSLNYKRRKRLWEQNIGSQSEMEQTLLVYRTSSSRMEALKIDYQQTLVTLENKVEKANKLVATERSLLRDLIVRSKIKGKVFSISKEVGEFISPQENFAEIGSNENFIVKMDIDEVDISKIELGDTALVQLEAFPDTLYTVTLSFISEMKDDITQTFRVEGVFKEIPLKMYNGLSGEANILVDRRQDALVIPSEYLIDENKVLTNEGEVDVVLGIKSLEFVEIIKGVDTSTILIKSYN